MKIGGNVKHGDYCRRGKDVVMDSKRVSDVCNDGFGYDCFVPTCETTKVPKMTTEVKLWWNTQMWKMEIGND